MVERCERIEIGRGGVRRTKSPWKGLKRSGPMVDCYSGMFRADIARRNAIRPRDLRHHAQVTYTSNLRNAIGIAEAEQVRDAPPLAPRLKLAWLTLCSSPEGQELERCQRKRQPEKKTRRAPKHKWTHMRPAGRRTRRASWRCISVRKSFWYPPESYGVRQTSIYVPPR